MKLKFETLIDVELDTVWAAFVDPGNRNRWQQHLESFRPVAGKPGHPGAVSEFIFDEKGRKVVVKETITERRQPDFLAGIYESPTSQALIVNHFEAVDDRSTRWTAWCNLTFRGVTKFVSLFVSGSVRRRTEEDMERFKLMVETDRANAAS